MRIRIARIGSGIVCVLACTVIASCIEPSDRRPGLALSGTLVESPVSDWSFTAAHREIFVETRTPYLIPHSVTIVCADADGELFIGSRNPETKRWVRWVERDPDVRLKIGDRLYEVRLERIETQDELARVRAAYAKKLGRPMDVTPDGEPLRVWFWKVASRS